MVIANNIGLAEFSNFMDRSGSNEKVHLMVSDGIMVDFLRQFPENVARAVLVERILTSYQLQKTLMETDDAPHFIGIRSEVISSWDSILRIWSTRRFVSCLVVSVVLPTNTGLPQLYSQCSAQAMKTACPGTP